MQEPRMQRFVARMIAMLMQERTILATTEYGFCHFSTRSREVYLVQQSLTVFWREEQSKIIETIIFEIPISITMEFAVISTTCVEFLKLQR